MREGERYKIRLHELEDEAVARHATYQPAYVRLKEAELKKEIALLRRKFQQLRRMSFERHEKYAAQAAVLLAKRHVVYDARMRHAHEVGLHTPVLENPAARPLNKQPAISS